MKEFGLKITEGSFEELFFESNYYSTEHYLCLVDLWNEESMKRVLQQFQDVDFHIADGLK